MIGCKSNLRAIAVVTALLLTPAVLGSARQTQSSEGPRVTWTKQFGKGVTNAASLTLERGWVYVVGKTSGSTFGRSAGGSDAYAVQFDINGHALWGRQYGSRHDDGFSAVVLDHSGRLHAVGKLDHGESSSCRSLMWLADLSRSGALIRTKSFGYGSLNCFAQGVAIDRVGNVYVVGSDNSDMPSGDIFKFARTGRLVWHKQLPYSTHGDNYSTAANAVDVDREGNAYVVGGGTSDRFCGFLAKLDPSGRELWHRDFRKTLGSDYIGVNSVRVRGSVYVVGSTAGGGKTGFVAALDTRGKLLWVRRLGGELDAVALDKRGGIYAAGYIGHGRPVGKADAVVVKFDPSGVLQWSKRLSLGADTRASGIGVDGAANVYVCGSTVPKAGTRRGFIVRMVP